MAWFVPFGHSKPTGQMLPVTPSRGMGVVAPRAQNHPGLQTPLGAVRPSPVHDLPGSHEMHCPFLSRPGVLLYVPFGQGNSCGLSVPTGQ